MCRSIHTLHNFEPPATEEEMRAAALQYVRKVSGYNKPSQANGAAFERAVDAVESPRRAASWTSWSRTPRRRTARPRRRKKRERWLASQAV